jgi:hypothetical protein
MGEPSGRAYDGRGCGSGSGAERSGGSYVTAGGLNCSGARTASPAAAGAGGAPPLRMLLPCVCSPRWPPAGCVVAGSVGGSRGDSGSHAGDGGVAARAGACRYCALKDVSLFMAAGCAKDGRRRPRGCWVGRLRLQLWGGSAMRECEGRGRGHVLMRSSRRAEAGERA